jgi:two-component system, NtrC family, sensor histidine kinase PilS
MSSSRTPHGEALRVRLLWLTLFRTVLAALVMVAVVAQLLNRGGVAGLGWREYASFMLMGLVFVVTLLTGLLLKAGEVSPAAAWLHVGFDVALSTSVCSITGGGESPFTFLFLLAIIEAAILRGRQGAALATLGSAATVLSLSVKPWAREAVPVRGVELGVQLLAQGLIGVLSAYMSEQLLRSDERLEVREHDLARLTRLHSQIVAAMPAGVLTCDAQRRLLLINPAASAILGPRPSQEVVDRLVAGTRELRRAEMLVPTEGRGERILGLSRTALAEEPGSTLVVFQDLTELRRLEGELERIDHLASLGRVSAELAHEIRNPLAAMRGAAQMLETEGGTQERLAKVIVREADRLAGLVEGYLRLARPPPPQPTRVPLDRVVGETVEMLRDDPSFASLELELQPAEARVDVGQLKQVMINLLRNAATAVKSGGRIKVRTRATASGPQIDVWDSAGAVREADQERIFEPFFSRSEGGTGLGLSTVRTIVQAHGGQVRVTSNQEEGTTFSVHLPVP